MKMPLILRPAALGGIISDAIIGRLPFPPAHGRNTHPSFKRPNQFPKDSTHVAVAQRRPSRCPGSAAARCAHPSPDVPVIGSPRPASLAVAFLRTNRRPDQ